MIRYLSDIMSDMSDCPGIASFYCLTNSQFAGSKSQKS